MRIINYKTEEETEVMEFPKFFHDELRKALWCELIVKEILPFMIKHATSEELAEALATLFLETEKQIMDMEDVFSLIELRTEERECDIMKGITDAVYEITNQARGKVRDAAILLVIQKIISHQIVTYRTLSMYLQRMKKTKAAYITEGICVEKKGADNRFYKLSVYINYAAMFEEIENDAAAFEDY